MKRSIFGKIKEKHLLAMIICCAIHLIAISALSFLGLLGSWGFYALMLFCPILHLLMMRTHSSSPDDQKHQQAIKSDELEKSQEMDGMVESSIYEASESLGTGATYSTSELQKATRSAIDGRRKII